MSKVHGKWTQVSRTKITSSIAKKAIKIENQVDEKLQAITRSVHNGGHLVRPRDERLPGSNCAWP